MSAAVATTRSLELMHDNSDTLLPSPPPTTSSILYTLDDLIHNRSQTIPDTPLLAYPATPKGRSDYVQYTANDLNRWADNGANKYASIGLVPNPVRTSEAETVALLAPSNMDYVATIFALTRLGFAVFLLSNRLAPEAYISLLKKTQCSRIIYSEHHREVMESVRTEVELTQYPVLTRPDYDITCTTPYPRLAGNKQDSTRMAIVIHSSGSTGLPKPIFQTHAACLSNYSKSFECRSFLTLPLFHNHGLSSFFRAVYSGKQIAVFNSNLPLTGPNLAESMNATSPDCFYGVPYAIKLLAESESGIDALRKCKLVLFGGSSCPDDLGDRLVKAGVNLVGHYGATEMGQLMTSFRPAGDDAWNYVRPMPSVAPYLYMAPRGGDTFECVVLDGLPSKVISNCDDPPNSFETRDIFTAHPTIPNAWKYLGRLDDRVTLVNGEKVLPIAYEHQLRQHELVRDAIVIGVGRAFPGLVIVPSINATGLSKEILLEKLWPVINLANSRVEGFSQVSREMIAILDVGVDYPCTDKGTLIRAAFYKKFERLIDVMYENFDAPSTSEGGLRLDLAQTKAFLLNIFTERFGKRLDESTDFFEAGVDSLQAIAIRGIIIRELDLGLKVPGQNVVFESPNVSSLAEHLQALQTGQHVEEKDEIQIMEELIKKYSNFEQHVPGSQIVDGETIILTGATGSLGAHVLNQLVCLEKVKAVYCLVRATDPEQAEERVRNTLLNKKIASVNFSKVHCLPADLSREDLGLSPAIINELRRTLTTVIHSAWAVNFNLGVKGFENQHINGTSNLLKLCLRTDTLKPAKLFFCSSISAAAGTPIPATIEETYISNLAHAQNMGYARSKLVTENIIANAGRQTGMLAKVLRVGQIIGDTVSGTWNSTEAISLMIRSTQTFAALPALDETPSWLPVDMVAKSVLELSGLNANSTPPQILSEDDQPSTVYHVQNSKTFHWTRDLLPALRDAGLDFKVVSQREWVDLLRKSEPNPDKNPTIKLLDFFTKKYDNDNPGRKGLVFSTDKTGEKSETIRNGCEVVGSGLVKKIVDAWMKEWTA